MARIQRVGCGQGAALLAACLGLALAGVLALGIPASAGEAGPEKAPGGGDEVGKRDGRLVFEDGFDKDLSNWQAEGPHTAEVKEGRLHVKTAQDSRNVGEYLWCRRELPADFRAEWDFTPASDSGFFLVFFCARGAKGEDILSRELFEEYMPHKAWKPYQDFDKYTSPPNRPSESRIACYHISYRRNAEANCNLRKNPGLNLVKSSDVQAVLPANKTVHVVLTKQGARITLAVDKKVFMDHTDDGKLGGGPLSGGRIGLRQVYDSDGYYDDFKVYDLGSGKG